MKTPGISMAILLLEIKRQFNKKTIGLFIVVVLLALYFVQIGTGNYENAIENIDTFRTFEKVKIQQYVNYNQYGTYGFRVLFVPSPLSIFFINSSTISQLTSNVDAGERLNLYNSFKGRTLFAEKSGGYKDFSGIMLLLGSLLVIYLGYESMIYKDYSRFMTGFTGHGRFFACILCSRLVLFSFLVLLSGGLALILLEINGIRLSPTELLNFTIYLGILELTMIFFFSLGTIAGSLKSRFAGFVMVIASWFVFVFLAPGIVSAITAGKADNIISNYRLELEKLKNLMDFEQRAIKEVGFTSEENIDAVRLLIESYWTNEFKKIQAFEKRLERDMQENIRLFESLSFILPSTFYMSSSNEISSKGYANFIRFFSYIQELKGKFVRFYLDKRYYLTPAEAGPPSPVINIEPFTKSRENLFYAESRLPGDLVPGTLLVMLYITGLLAASYIRFKKSLRL